MVEKKLLTLACAVGILAFGACFLPPLPAPKPPPMINLRSVRAIRVSVTNDSPSRHVDPSLLSRAAISHINLLSKGVGVTAFEPGKAGSEDAVLEVSIVSESVTAAPPSRPGGCEDLEFLIGISAKLKRADGRVIWQETNDGHSVSACLTGAEPSDSWNDRATQFRLMDAVGKRLAYHMFNGS